MGASDKLWKGPGLSFGRKMRNRGIKARRWARGADMSPQAKFARQMAGKGGGPVNEVQKMMKATDQKAQRHANKLVIGAGVIPPVATTAAGIAASKHYSDPRTWEKKKSFASRIDNLIELSGDWKTIDQRKDSMNEARRWKRRGQAAIGAGIAIGGASAYQNREGIIQSFRGAKAKDSVIRSLAGKHAKKSESAKIFGGAIKRLPTPVKIGAGLALAGGALAGGAKGVEKYQQKRINDRRKSRYYGKPAELAARIDALTELASLAGAENIRSVGRYLKMNLLRKPQRFLKRGNRRGVARVRATNREETIRTGVNLVPTAVRTAGRVVKESGKQGLRTGRNYTKGFFSKKPYEPMTDGQAAMAGVKDIGRRMKKRITKKTDKLRKDGVGGFIRNHPKSVIGGVAVTGGAAGYGIGKRERR